MKLVSATPCRLAALLLSAPLAAVAAPPFAFSNYPLFLAPAIRPNVMVILDNSESMDATMSGKVIDGNDPNTRGNIARGILRGLLTSYRDSFNFGITSFRTSSVTLYNTHAYYLGNATTMVYTNDCVAGVSVTNAGRRCIANPQPGNGFLYITYDRSGDDADINDVLYSGATDNQLYGIGVSGTSYNVYRSHDNSAGWAAGNFSGGYGTWNFTPTDAGFLPQVAQTPRQLWIRRGWGYGDNITGAGNINEAVRADSASHFATMMTLLGNETNGATGEIKNNAFYTPIAGTLSTVKDYFRGGTTPITQTCQRNFIMLATDGNPTGRSNGSQYNPSEWQNTVNGAGVWTYGQAQRDVFDQLTALRTTTVAARNYDVQTYVVGMGDTLANPSSIAALNQMALLGGGYPDRLRRQQRRVAAARLPGHRRRHPGQDQRRLVGRAQHRLVDDGLGAVPGQVQQLGLVGQPAQLRRRQQRRDQHDGDLGRRCAGQGAALEQRPGDPHLQAVGGRRSARDRVPLALASGHARGDRARHQPDRRPQPDAGGGSDAFGEQRLRFLRGDASYESRNCAVPPCAAPQFRNRAISPLGDVINSSPYYVGAPNFGYYDDFEAARYSSFVNAYRTRTPMIYAGGNDGMLHGFDAHRRADGRREDRLRAEHRVRQPHQAHRQDLLPPLLRRRLADGRRRQVRRRQPGTPSWSAA